jgi:signal recognition particle subunit SRP54
LASGESFTLEDFLEQMMALKNMGPLGKVLGMLPGSGQMKSQIENIDEKELDRTAAIIRSMTPSERSDPKILNASRRLRIANGSGTRVNDVNNLVDRFGLAAKMFKQVAKGGVPNVPGVPLPPGVGGGKKLKQNQPANKKKSKSGNPAKRAAEESGESLRLPGQFKGLLDK